MEPAGALRRGTSGRRLRVAGRAGAAAATTNRPPRGLPKPGTRRRTMMPEMAIMGDATHVMRIFDASLLAIEYDVSFAMLWSASLSARG